MQSLVHKTSASYFVSYFLLFVFLLYLTLSQNVMFLHASVVEQLNRAKFDLMSISSIW